MATIYDVRDALKELPDDIQVFHFYAPEQKPDKYIIWAETEIDFELYAGDEPNAVTPRGQIYYYTTEEYDRSVNEIVRALIEHGIDISITNIGWDYVFRHLVYEISFSVGWEFEDGTGEIYQ